MASRMLRFRAFPMDITDIGQLQTLLHLFATKCGAVHRLLLRLFILAGEMVPGQSM